MASEGSYGAAFSYGRGTHVGQFPHSGHENNETIANVDGLVPEHSSEWFPKLSPKSFREWTVQMKTLDPDSLILPNVDIDAKGKMPESPTKLAVTMGPVEIVQLLPSFQNVEPLQLRTNMIMLGISHFSCKEGTAWLEIS